MKYVRCVGPKVMEFLISLALISNSIVDVLRNRVREYILNLPGKGKYTIQKLILMFVKVAVTLQFM